MRWLAGLFALAMSACGEPSELDLAETDDRLEWRAAPGNSHFATGPPILGSRREAIRCWGAEGAFDCIRLSNLRELAFKATRFQASRLPPRASDIRELSPRYECSFSDQAVTYATESIMAPNGDELTSLMFATISGDREPWSRAFVEGYFRENGLANFDATYFDCRRLRSAIEGGSAATLGTTSVTRSILR